MNSEYVNFRDNPVRDRCIGMMIGLAIGDALGTTNEFLPTAKATKLTGIIGGGPFKLAPGQWTDDTSMALCLLESLLENGFNAKDQMSRYLKWRNTGYMSCTGTCFDIGNITSEAITRFQNTGEPYQGSIDNTKSGNGGIMRLAPVVVMNHDDLKFCIGDAKKQSKTTHGSAFCIDSAAVLGEILFNCVNREETDTKDDVLTIFDDLDIETQLVHDLVEKAEYKTKSFDDVFNTSGFVVSTLEFALWCFYHTNSFTECVLLAANAGGDADTNAAVAGQIAGAYYGHAGIPDEWISTIWWNRRIINKTTELFDKK